MKRRNLIFNLLALLTVTVWGVTFVSTKILISAGLTPTWIFICRFVIAYLCVLCISHRPWFANTCLDELKMMALGLTGGSLYFIAENTALEYTFASNVSLIICAAPVLTLFIDAIVSNTSLRDAEVHKKSISSKAIIGSVIAIAGVAMIVFNGTLNLGINPLGDFLTLLAALFWATYCILLTRMSRRYSNLFITRKVFFYGFTTALLFAFFTPSSTVPIATALSSSTIPIESSLVSPNEAIGQLAGWSWIAGWNWTVILNLLFLGVVASFLCYLMWNQCIKVLGPQKTSNYIYFVPLVTILTSSLILQDPITLWLLLGAITIISGVYLTTK